MVNLRGRLDTDAFSKKPHGSKFLLEEKSIVTQGPETKEAKTFSLYKVWILQLGKEQAGKVCAGYEGF